MPVMLRVLLVALALGCAVRARAEDRWVHTRDVADMIRFDGALWVASTGGVERYELPLLEERQHLTREHGLDSLDVLALEVEDGQLVARTARSRCVLSPERARCAATRAALPTPRLSGRAAHGAPITKELALGPARLVGTRGAGVWLELGSDARKLTPDGQICGNHVQALARFQSELWVGTFRDGLCVRRGATFVSIATPFRFVNALLGVDDALYVAAHEGLFRSPDGVSFERVDKVAERGVNGLARAGDALYVSTPVSLYRLPLARGRSRTWWTPAGSSAVQGVSVHHGEVWLASEDRGAIRVSEREERAFDALAGLDSSWVVDVAGDGHGTTYVATLKHGLFAITPAGRISRLPTPSPWLLRLAAIDDTVCVGSQDGLSCLGAEPDAERALAGDSIHALFAFEGWLWAGTENGLVALPWGTATVQVHPRPRA